MFHPVTAAETDSALPPYWEDSSGSLKPVRYLEPEEASAREAVASVTNLSCCPARPQSMGTKLREEASPPDEAPQL